MPGPIRYVPNPGTCNDPRGYTGQAGYSQGRITVPTGSLTPLLRWSSDTPDRPSRAQVEVSNDLAASGNQVTNALDPAAFLVVRYSIGLAQYEVPVDLRPGGSVFGVLASSINLLLQNAPPPFGGDLLVTASIAQDCPEAPPATRTIVASIPIAPPLSVPVPLRARFVTVMPSVVNTYAFTWVDGNGTVIGGFNLPMPTGSPIPIVVPAGAATLNATTNPTGALVPTSFVFELDI